MGKCLSCYTDDSTDQGALVVHSSERKDVIAPTPSSSPIVSGEKSIGIDGEDKEIEINGEENEFEIAVRKKEIEIDDEEKVTEKSNKESVVSEIIKIMYKTSDDIIFVKAKDYSTEVNVEAAFANKDVILFYFSTNSCPTCKEFTPVLVDFYNNVKGHGVEIIFVTLDENLSEMVSSMKESHGDWLAYTYDTKIVKMVKEVKQKYGSEFDLPYLIVLNLDNGKFVTYDGVDQIMKTSKGSDQIELVRDWKEIASWKKGIEIDDEESKGSDQIELVRDWIE